MDVQDREIPHNDTAETYQKEDNNFGYIKRPSTNYHVMDGKNRDAVDPFIYSPAVLFLYPPHKLTTRLASTTSERIP